MMPSLEGLATKATKAPSYHQVRPALSKTSPYSMQILVVANMLVANTDL